MSLSHTMTGIQSFGSSFRSLAYSAQHLVQTSSADTQRCPGPHRRQHDRRSFGHDGHLDGLHSPGESPGIAYMHDKNSAWSPLALLLKVCAYCVPSSVIAEIQPLVALAIHNDVRSSVLQTVNLRTASSCTRVVMLY
ncbi:uncharacterized protein HMPREF1120_00154 [Exophiala dermatitidis NIH/UT8656]|uniref:Uncharacterized protein n=1 Tax=Exophiala dermatitidis (strain ATCC 34100 / CBS 525.76 / NIH/UT8656) TaxID=858893 RepID=H6BLU2_EXODN|nr:uncharacterized protein HMPREF1120_00154 [Exophiala dermatitidis NIH/UT8656]EHY51931.1 hypothetical protein HMPREF1120_00154 [Exophiala dermatitidis NIH/UT8656]